MSGYRSALPAGYGIYAPAPAVAQAGFKSLLGFWLGGISAPSGVTPPVVVEQPDGPHGPGWHLFGRDGYHPPSTRKRKVEDLEQDIVRAYEDATGITAERERLEAIREIKRVAATALSVAKKEDDAQLKAVASQIIALKTLKDAEAYLARVGEILAQLQAQEDDDMQAFMLMARLA